MNKVDKLKLLSFAKADAAADIKLINQYSLKELQPEEVFCFSIILCDNEVDRDNERFTEAALRALAPLFTGKTGICDHDWSVEKQVTRLYRCEVEKTGEKNSLGEDKLILRGDAYMLRNESTNAMVASIEGGIIKEVSVGCSVGRTTCSICGEPMIWGGCKGGHQKGREYDGKLCFGELDDAKDAYEFSFVTVPAQRGAGITKSAEGLDSLFEKMMAANIDEYDREKIQALVNKGQAALLSADERKKREDIIAKYSKQNEN